MIRREFLRSSVALDANISRARPGDQAFLTCESAETKLSARITLGALMKRSWAILWLILPAASLAADDARVMRLEQDVRNLQREVQNLSRQIDQLRLQTTRPSADGRLPPPPPPVTDTSGWLDASKWKKLRPGMSELEVIATLGAPTSARERDGAHELLYAMEIGTSAFLGGSVLLRDRKVVEVRMPTLQ